MDRMTFLNGDDMWCVTNDNCFEEQSEHYCGPAIEKLAFYEDTGLTPDEIEGLKNTYDQLQASFDSLWLSYIRLSEAFNAYSTAEADERIVVLPCKVGDTVWLTRWWRGLTPEEQNPPISRTVQYFGIEKNGVVIHFHDGCLTAEELGKTVFLTCEEAEAALKGGGRDG